MTVRVRLSGAGLADLAAILTESVRRSQPSAIGVASAFVTVAGVEHLGRILGPRRAKVRLIAGTSLGLTQPTAIAAAAARRWEVRLGHSPSAVFHPKLIVGGRSFRGDGLLESPCFAAVGSANLTSSAMSENVECTCLLDGGSAPEELGKLFQQLWQDAEPVTNNALRAYCETFSERIQTRTTTDLRDLGIDDIEGLQTVTAQRIRTCRRARFPAVSHDEAGCIWVGLESSTGAYTFQPEFPKRVARLVLRILEENGIQPEVRGDNRQRRVVANLDVECSDGEVREMTFTHYFHNGMSRLNVPNEVPRAEWARDSRSGIAVLRRCNSGRALVFLDILPPGKEADRVVQRSFVLDTWDVTPTRAYGWY